MPVTLGLSGFGRIGRNLFRLLYTSDDIRIGAISDVADPEALVYLLRYDSILGRFPDRVAWKNGRLTTPGGGIPMLSGKEAESPRWADLGVDYVIEATGRDCTRAEIEGFGRTKGSIHFTAAKPLPPALLDELIRTRVADLAVEGSE